uniref:protein-methionine-sulfoxide reductase heme-binding subunit MsrQ n=1 Tax=Ningiella ruwaisensis TaxID=2364274 RepID=UPI00109EF900|nr:protein-methionine-sulfoxide reductase heme-binding subunit MsrQ [Ningiella ruwaisensis]
MMNLTTPVRVPSYGINALRYAIHVVAFCWLAWVYYLALNGSLDGDPVQYLLDFSGIGTLHLLMLSLLVSPIAMRFKFAQLMQIRKTLGVYAASYALFHFYVFTAYELQYEWKLILSEIVERPYITVGMVALLILSALLLTSLNKIKKRMGKNWQKLHNFTYLALILGCIHYLWSVKSDWYEPAIYIVLATILLLFRRKKIQKIIK